jgi:hypothetical protein
LTLAAAHALRGLQRWPRKENRDMINKIEVYADAGTKTAKARNCGDEACARFHSDWARRALHLESEAYRTECRTAFDNAYKQARNVPRVS